MLRKSFNSGFKLLRKVKFFSCTGSFQIVLNSFAECVDSMYACVLIHGKICVATESWWTLSPNERKLLSILGSAEHDSTAKDCPVFLPQKSQNASTNCYVIEE